MNGHVHLDTSTQFQAEFFCDSVWQNETSQDLSIHLPVSGISKKHHEEIEEQLNEDGEFSLECNRNIQSSEVLKQQHSTDHNFKNQSQNCDYNTLRRLNEMIDTGHSIFTDKDLFSDRNVGYSQSFSQTRGNKLRKISPKQIISPSNQGEQVLNQYHTTQFNPIHLGVQQPSVNPVNPALFISNNMFHVTTKDILTQPTPVIYQGKQGAAILNDRSLQTSNIIPNPVFTDTKLSPKNKKGSTDLNVNKIDVLQSSQKTKRRVKSKRKITNPVTIKQLSDSHCETCNVDCGSATLLTEHKEGSFFICRVCASNFDSHKVLEDHFVSHKASYTCWTCGLKFYTRHDFIKHEKDSPACTTQTTVTCDICQKTVKNKTVLRAHVKNMHGGDNYPCCVCGKSFKQEHKVNTHLRYTHIAYEHIKCEHCPKIFLGPEHLKNHVLNNHTIMNEKEALKFTCPKCGVVLKNEYALKNHILKHDTQICDLCGDSFQGYHALHYHKTRNHPKSGVFPCTECDKTFNLSWDLVEHRRTQHRVRSKHKGSFCEICGKIYKGNIKLHYLMHSGEKNFECSICKQQFNQRVTRDTHMRVHSDVGKYTCEVCGKSFRWKQTMQNHEKKCSNTTDNWDNSA